ncbi:hypothetical protein KC343_g3766 [Hortaea werneckii]|nr:hypothetical protein KC352_g17615 [Hortaea werneckii]KAI7572258.1 hypothetical protein KC317_g915 [Hortaea werneckii]KAI7608137.1 hypothetical protein KC346_g9737 [Hortaea werneckii]KAI7631887.1 hypothetical protein KC343_g3766 [Hortaea werneckii]KAI7661623.1 hypothetical protein KC319_g8365 [Hortaea werneckii]
MWLINVTSRTLEWFDESQRPPYAILSHTWERDEIGFHDMPKVGTVYSPDNAGGFALTDRQGYRKLDFTCQQAVQHGLSYIWIDSCCIDKDSSAQLSEAINSMFRWYTDAEVCYAYLSDLDLPAPPCSGYGTLPSARPDDKENFLFVSLSQCKWFRRGWTLQELIAPVEVIFFDRAWSFVTTRSSASKTLSRITRVHSPLLRWSCVDRCDNAVSRIDHTVAPAASEARFSRCLNTHENAINRARLPRDLRSYSVAQRMSWAVGRETLRKEDEAYSLLGLFCVHMPLLYGEGPMAFIRLQIEIIKAVPDHSILAWELPRHPDDRSNAGTWDGGLLAPSPSCFAGAGEIVCENGFRQPPFDITNFGLRASFHSFGRRNRKRVVLACVRKTPPIGLISLTVSRRSPADPYAIRTGVATPHWSSRKTRLHVTSYEEMSRRQPKAHELLLVKDPDPAQQSRRHPTGAFSVQYRSEKLQTVIQECIPATMSIGGEELDWVASTDPHERDLEQCALRLCFMRSATMIERTRHNLHPETWFDEIYDLVITKATTAPRNETLHAGNPTHYLVYLHRRKCGQSLAESVQEVTTSNGTATVSHAFKEILDVWVDARVSSMDAKGCHIEVVTKSSPRHKRQEFINAGIVIFLVVFLVLISFATSGV